ncbi:MAG TPA: SDR family NAD(P)-dependent oxidoreductase, partial [Bacteroidales bacterium]|nr:SDR family NAD(P)-dependent oxidoreductase [Bacteroidales bacterium]
MDLQLKNKTAFISGSGKGIGFAIAARMAREGANVILNGRTAKSVDEAVHKLKTSNYEGSVSGLVADFAKKDEIESLISKLPDLD